MIPVNAASFAAWRERSRTLESLALIEPDTSDLTGAGETRQVVVDAVSASLLHVLRVAPRLGRDFTQEEDQPQKNHVVILSDGFWRSRRSRISSSGWSRASPKTIRLHGLRC